MADAGADAVGDRHPVLGPDDRRAHHPGGVAAGAARGGRRPPAVLDALARADLAVPVCVMTYYNIVFRAGLRRFARSLADAGVAGAIIPDLPLEEGGEWCAEADAAGVATVLLVAPSTPAERARAICDRSRGFVYGVGVMGVTGERAELAASARQRGHAWCARVTDRPVCIGIGVSTARAGGRGVPGADGVVVGSAIVRRLLDGAGPEGRGRVRGRAASGDRLRLT